MTRCRAPWRCGSRAIPSPRAGPTSVAQLGWVTAALLKPWSFGTPLLAAVGPVGPAPGSWTSVSGRRLSGAGEPAADGSGGEGQGQAPLGGRRYFRGGSSFGAG